MCSTRTASATSNTPATVNGNQRVTIDFTSPQLNDVLQSLTVLDEGGGRIAGVNYNSTTPLAEQLKTLSLGMNEDPTSTDLFGALRGQRVEVTGGSRWHHHRPPHVDRGTHRKDRL